METSNTDLEQALSFANYQSTLNQQRRLLKEKFEIDTIVPYNGGLFKITQEWLGGFDRTSTWILDMNGTPVVVADPDLLYETAKTAYRTAIESYGNEFQKLRTQRSVKRLTDL